MVTIPTTVSSGILDIAKDIFDSPIGTLGIIIAGISLLFLFFEIILNRQ
jgi:hypothetical protein